MLNLLACRSIFFQVLRDSSTTNYSCDNIPFISTSLVLADSIALPSQKMSVIPLLSVLPDSLKQFYSLEENLVSTDENAWTMAQSFPPKLCMPRLQYHKLLLRLHHLGMIKFLCKNEVKMVNSIHCVVKNNNKQHLIFDGRAVNSVFYQPDPVALPSFSLLQDWMLAEGETAVVAKLDIDNYYHRLGVPSWMSKYLAIPPVSPSDLLVLDPTFSLPSAPLLFPACITLPMGLAHAVLLAQTAHLFFVSSLPCASLINTHVLSTAPLWCLIYIDDVIVVAKHHQMQKAKKKANTLINQILCTYQQFGLVVNQAKVQWAASQGEALGCTINGLKGCVLPNYTKLCNVIKATRYLLTLPLVRHKWVEKLLGSWIWFLLLRRPLFSILVNMYKFLHVVSASDLIPLWPSVQKEFEILICLSEFCALDWRRSMHPLLCATDASLLGAGACTSTISFPLSNSMLSSSISTTIADLTWSTLLSVKWQRLEHINILEARALLMAFSRFAQSPSSYHQRFTFLLDSQVVYFMIRKGLKPNTIRTYRSTLQKALDKMGDVCPTNLDEQLVRYVELAPSSARRSLSEKLIYAVKHFFPHLSLQLQKLARFTKLLKKEFPSATKPPMVEEVVLSVVAQLILMGFPTTALAVYTQFDLYLRPAELCAIQTDHFLFPGGDILGNFTGKLILVLPHTKTGPLQSVDVRIPLLQKLLLRLVTASSSNELIFPTYSNYATRLAQALDALHLSYVGYTPHSIRHGAATADLLQGGYQALSTILYRGRWESNAGKRYLKMGAALLLAAKLPPNFVSHASDIKQYLEPLFNGTSLLPRK